MKEQTGSCEIGYACVGPADCESCGWKIPLDRRQQPRNIAEVWSEAARAEYRRAHIIADCIAELAARRYAGKGA